MAQQPFIDKQVRLRKGAEGCSEGDYGKRLQLIQKWIKRSEIGHPRKKKRFLVSDICQKLFEQCKDERSIPPEQNKTSHEEKKTTSWAEQSHTQDFL